MHTAIQNLWKNAGSYSNTGQGKSLHKYIEQDFMSDLTYNS